MLSRFDPREDNKTDLVLLSLIYERKPQSLRY